MCSDLKDWQKKLTEYFSKQEGQNYPCSNQVVVCGFVSPYVNDWKKFVKKLNKEIIWRTRQFEVVLSNNERWVFINPNENYIRGYRFYKVLANKNIDKKIIDWAILPICSFYCKSFEWF
jgi:hypothetical protein